MTLRRRITLALVALIALFTLVQGGLAVLTLHEQEDELVDGLVLSEARRLAARLTQSGPEVLNEDPSALLPEGYQAWWTGPSGHTLPTPLPAGLRGLADGPHLDSAPEAEYHILVMPAAGGRLHLRYDATPHENKVRDFGAQVFTLGVFFTALAAWMSRYVASLLIAPLEKLARLLDRWAPAPAPDAAPPVDEEHRVLEAFQRVQARWEHSLTREHEHIADIHHEIRTPLTALRTDIELLQLRAQTAIGANTSPNALPRDAERLQRALATVDAIAGTLDAMRAQQAGRPGPAQQVPLADCVDDAWASLGDLPAERGLALRNEVAPEAHSLLDRQALMAILRNLFRNAAEHAAPATVRVHQAAGALWVQDDGPGIRQEELASVFERYYRGRLADAPDQPAAPDSSAGHSPNAYARGLGLAIARQVAEANGWRLWAEAAQPRGTRFVLALQAQPAPTPAA